MSTKRSILDILNKKGPVITVEVRGEEVEVEVKPAGYDSTLRAIRIEGRMNAALDAVRAEDPENATWENVPDPEVFAEQLQFLDAHIVSVNGAKWADLDNEVKADFFHHLGPGARNDIYSKCFESERLSDEEKKG